MQERDQALTLRSSLGERAGAVVPGPSWDTCKFVGAPVEEMNFGTSSLPEQAHGIFKRCQGSQSCK